MITEKELQIMCEIIKEKYPNKDADFYKLFLSTELLRLLVENDWVNQTIFPNYHGFLQKHNRNAVEYFRSKDNGFQWQERISRLAQRIYNLQGIKNFDIILDSIRSGELVSRFAEIEAGNFLFGRGINFEFTKPLGIKGQDFDIKILSPISVNCEVKHKIEQTTLSERTLNETLSHANKQLPKDAPAIVFIKIPTEWTLNNETMQKVVSSISGFFKRNKGYIIGIMFTWERQDTEIGGIFYWEYKFIPNNFFEGTNDTNEFIQLLNSNRIHGVNFREVVQNFILNI